MSVLYQFHIKQPFNIVNSELAYYVVLYITFSGYNELSGLKPTVRSIYKEELLAIDFSCWFLFLRSDLCLK